MLYIFFQLAFACLSFKIQITNKYRFEPQLDVKMNGKSVTLQKTPTTSVFMPTNNCAKVHYGICYLLTISTERFELQAEVQILWTTHIFKTIHDKLFKTTQILEKQMVQLSIMCWTERFPPHAPVRPILNSFKFALEIKFGRQPQKKVFAENLKRFFWSGL